MGRALQAKQYTEMKNNLALQEKQTTKNLYLSHSYVIQVDNFSKIYCNLFYKLTNAVHKNCNYTVMQVILFVQYRQVASHTVLDLIKNCRRSVSMSNSLKCGVIAKSKKPCHEKNDMAQSDRIFIFLTSWQNRDSSHFLKIAMKIVSNREKLHRKIATKIVVICCDLTTPLQRHVQAHIRGVSS